MVGQHRRANCSGAHGGAAAVRRHRDAIWGSQVLQSEPDQRAEARSNHCQRHNREAASNARTPEPGSDAATPGRGDPLEVSRRIRGAEPGAAGNSARLDRERDPWVWPFNSGSRLLMNRRPLGPCRKGDRGNSRRAPCRRGRCGRGRAPFRRRGRGRRVAAGTRGNRFGSPYNGALSCVSSTGRQTCRQVVLDKRVSPQRFPLERAASASS